MKSKSLGESVLRYKQLVKSSDIQYAYSELVKYVQRLKNIFSKKFSDDYAVGNVLHGYMDYTYFYLSSDALKAEGLKLGLVLNHAEANFELWPLGQTKDIQKKYWELIKETPWIQGTKMPIYSIFGVTLIQNPDFDNLEDLKESLETKFIITNNKEVMKSLKRLN